MLVEKMDECDSGGQEGARITKRAESTSVYTTAMLVLYFRGETDGPAPILSFRRRCAASVWLQSASTSRSVSFQSTPSPSVWVGTRD